MNRARGIYEKSLALLGQKEGENTEGFEDRAPVLINVLLAQLSSLDLAMKGRRSTEKTPPLQIGGLEEEVGYEDAIVLSLIPLGLAGLLIQEEEPERGSFFLNLYRTEREHMEKNARFSRVHSIRRNF